MSEREIYLDKTPEELRVISLKSSDEKEIELPPRIRYRGKLYEFNEMMTVATGHTVYTYVSVTEVDEHGIVSVS